MKWTVSSRNRNSGCIPFGGDYILSVSFMNPGSTSILVKSRCMTLLLLQRAGLFSESQNLQKNTLLAQELGAGLSRRCALAASKPDSPGPGGLPLTLGFW